MMMVLTHTHFREPYGHVTFEVQRIIYKNMPDYGGYVGGRNPVRTRKAIVVQGRVIEAKMVGGLFAGVPILPANDSLHPVGSPYECECRSIHDLKDGTTRTPVRCG